VSPTRLDAPEVCVFGAGSIGCYLGGRLLASGAAVSFVGRPRLRDEVSRYGLRLTDFKGMDVRVQPSAIRFDADAAVAASAAVILVAVKSAATQEAAATLAAVIRPGTVVISFQNGLDNAALLRRGLPGCTVLGGMVPFNVAARGDGVFHQGSDGQLMVEDDPALSQIVPAFAAAGLPLQPRSDFRAVQWAKLLLNLNNAVNALCGLPLKTELSQRDYRRCLAAAQREAMALLKTSGIPVAKLTPLPPGWFPVLLCLPDVLFARAAQRMLAIDPLARSSMLDDLDAGRRTEIDWINGEVVKLAASRQRRAPVNEQLIRLVRAAESGGRRDWTGGELIAQLKQAATLA